MIDSHNKYIFTLQQRNTMFSIVGMLFAVGLILNVSAKVWPGEWSDIIKFGNIVLIFTALISVIEYLRNHKYLYAKYAIDRDQVTVFIGKEKRSINKEDAYSLSVVKLYQPSGKSYRYKDYIALWKDIPPKNGKHPLSLLKKTPCILLPYSQDSIHLICKWANIDKIPFHPKVLYHPLIKR